MPLPSTSLVLRFPRPCCPQCNPWSLCPSMIIFDGFCSWRSVRFKCASSSLYRISSNAAC
eukprot:8939315-Pyramimonas_sp.AAC.1